LDYIVSFLHLQFYNQGVLITWDFQYYILYFSLFRTRETSWTGNVHIRKRKLQFFRWGIQRRSYYIQWRNSPTRT